MNQQQPLSDDLEVAMGILANIEKRTAQNNEALQKEIVASARREPVPGGQDKVKALKAVAANLAMAAKLARMEIQELQGEAK